VQSEEGSIKGKEREKKANIIPPFNMLLRLDLTEAPKELHHENEDKENEYFWFIRFFSTENIALMKDTSKEEREAALKESWEVKNIGRAEKAKFSRKKYLLISKKNRGEQLTPEEETLLNEIRNQVYLTQLEKERKSKGGKEDGKKTENKDINRDGKSAGSKNSKDKAKINPLNDPNMVSKSQFLKQSFYNRANRTRLLPKPEHHAAHYLKKFLSYAYRDRVMHSENKINKFCLDEDKVHRIKFNVDKRLQEYNVNKNKESLRFDERKKKMIEETKNMNIKNINKRKNYSGKLNELLQSRVSIIDLIDNIIDHEKKLKEILNGEYELDRAIAIYKETISNNSYYLKFKDLCNDIFNYISKRKEEIYKAEIKKFNPREKNTLMKMLDDCNTNNWNISDETLNKMNELVK
jgi:hypothetical protein